LTTFRKLSNLDWSFRFDNFSKVVKSGVVVLDLTTFRKLSNLDWSFDLTTFERTTEMFKQQLRPRFLTKRTQLTAEELEQCSRAIRDNFFQYFSLREIHSLHLYLPILKRNEINTWLIIHHLWQHYPDLTVVTSKIELSQNTMRCYRLTPETILLENRWQVPEPVNSSEFPEAQLDMVLLPLLCFDRQGHRVGYGKGYYDKFLVKCKPEIIKVGLSLFVPVETIADVYQGDVKLNFCVTPQEIFSFGVD